MINTRLVNFLSTDKLRLPGALYEPEHPTKAIAIWLHGMGDNGIFYKVDTINELGKQLTDKAISFFAFNNRGAHSSKIIKKISSDSETEEYQGGTFYEKIEDCVHDIDGALEFLGNLGYETFYLIGISTGANKICAYDFRKKPSPFSKYVFISPGDDSGLYYQELGKNQFKHSLEQALRMIEAGHGEDIMPIESGMHPFSADSTADILDPDGAYSTFPYYEASHERLGSKQLFNEMRNVTTPSLFVLAENDEYFPNPGGAIKVKKLLTDSIPIEHSTYIDFEIVKEADHSFHAMEHTLASVISTWLST